MCAAIIDVDVETVAAARLAIRRLIEVSRKTLHGCRSKVGLVRGVIVFVLAASWGSQAATGPIQGKDASILKLKLVSVQDDALKQTAFSVLIPCRLVPAREK